MESKPKISYVMPTKNRIQWMPECLVSLLGQTVNDVEVVVVNDGSDDGTKEFLESWGIKDKRVKVIHNEKSVGAGESRNIGMKAASAPLIGVCDDDDIYGTDRTEKTLKWFKDHPFSELVNFPYAQIGYFNEFIKQFDGQEFNHDQFKKNGEVNYYCNPSVAYKKDPVMKMGGYPKENDKVTDDYQFITNWVKGGHKVDFSPGHYINYHRVLPDSMMVKHRGFESKWVNK